MKKSPRLKILILQDHLEAGGAARAASRHARALEQAGHAVVQVAGDATETRKTRCCSGKPATGWSRLFEKLLPRPQQRAGRSRRVQLRWGQILNDLQPDLVWCHNLAGAGKWGWSLAMLETALSQKPVVWTLHDMWALGEGEPYFDEEKIADFRHSPLRRLAQHPRIRQLKVSAPSRWLTNLARAFPAGAASYLPNPLDLSIFRPVDKSSPRQDPVLSLMAVADSYADPRKGFSLLMQAFQQAQKGSLPITLNLMARDCPADVRRIPGVRVHSPTLVERELAVRLAAADLFVHPASRENAPCVIQEALACGTPVAAFSVGGIPEMIEEQKTGWLLGPPCLVTLAELFQRLAKNPSILGTLRRASREQALREYSPDAVVARFEALVGDLLPVQKA